MPAGPLPLTPLEEGILAWERVSIPWNMHLDLTAPRLDLDRLRQAFNTAIHHHELTACAIERDHRDRPHWVTDPDADVGAIEVVDGDGPAAVDRVRLRVLDTRLDVSRAPLVRPVVVRLPDHDVVITCASHVLCDGLSLLRFVRSVTRAYAGEPDPPPAASLEEARALLDGPRPTTWAQLGARWSGALALAGSLGAERDRMAPRGAWEAGGYGFVSTTVPSEEIRAARRGRSAFDAYAMAALHLAVDRWNSGLGEPPGRLGITQGVNLRPAAWPDDVVVNLAVAVSVQTLPEDRTSIDAALAAVAPQLEVDRRQAVARRMLDGARAAQVLPPRLRSRAIGAAPANLFDTCVISNVGVQPPPSFDPAFAAEAWGSTIATPASGMTIAVGGSGGRVQFDVRFRRERFDDDAVRAFLGCFADALRAG